MAQRQKKQTQVQPVKTKNKDREYSSNEFISLDPNIKFTQQQIELQQKINSNTITICFGPAGTSKTYSTLYQSLKMIKENPTIKKIIVSKSIEEAGGQGIGFLKGDLDTKVLPYFESFLDNSEKIIGKQALEGLVKDGKLSFKPISYMRGITFDGSIMILDEAQNCDFRELLLFVSRVGKNSHIIILGDCSQTDIAKNKMGLASFAEMIGDIKGVATHEFTKGDVVRNKILIEITDRYEKWLAEGKVTKSK